MFLFAALVKDMTDPVEGVSLPKSTIVQTTLGKLQGLTFRSKIVDKVYTSFKGIPYAQPPIGDLRFAQPQPVKPWQGELDCRYKESPPCWQVHPLFPEHKLLMKGQEDCLYLNVFTPWLPREEANELLPVIFWIHGGAFGLESNNSKMYGPDYFLEHEIVLVTINYR